MAMRTMTAATALAAAFAAVFLTAGTAMAKRDFSVRSEVRCDEAGTMCYDARSGAPFSGELRLYYPDGKVQASLFYANGRQDGKYRVFFADGGLRYSGYCLTPQGQRIDFSADIAAFAETGKTPCDEMMAQAEKDSLPGEK